MKKVGACNIDTELGENQYYIGQANSLSGTHPSVFAGGGRTKCIVICYSKGSGQFESGYQEFYCYNRQEGRSISRRYYRIYDDSTQTWNDWQRIYDEGMLVDSGYDLSPLANALGVMKTTEIPSNADMNDYKTPGIYRTTNNSIAVTIINGPASLGGKTYTMVVLPGIQNGRAFQIIFVNALASGNTSIYVRSYSTSWSGWYSLETTLDSAS